MEIIDRQSALEMIRKGYTIFATIGEIGSGIQVIQITKDQILDWDNAYLKISKLNEKQKIIII